MRATSENLQTWAAVVLCGGASSRMGADKARLLWGGVSAVERLTALCSGLGIATVITAGADHGLPVVLDAVPGAGPVGGVLAAARWLRPRGYQRALLLAVDAPTVEASDLAPLLAAGGPGAIYAQQPLPMALALAAIPPEAEDGWALGRLAEAGGLATLACEAGARARLRGANTPQERAALLAALKATG